MNVRTLVRAILLATALCSLNPVDVGAADVLPVPTFQGTVGARIFGPGRIAAASSGRFFVVDGRHAVSMLTARGDFVAVVLDDVVALAAGPGKIFAVTGSAELVTIDDRFGRVLSRAGLGLARSPVGVSYDAARGVVWMVFEGGAVQSRRPDGSVAVQYSPVTTGFLAPADVALDAQADLLWIAQSGGKEIVGLLAADGTKAKVIGAGGVGPAKVASALALGSGGLLYVTDQNTGTVEVVDSVGTRLQSIAVSAAGAGVAAQPAGIAFMSNGDLLVADMFASQLDRFGVGTPLPVCAGDSDCDGMPDAWETSHGLNPNDPRDALLDLDGDGLTNAEEFALGTDPTRVDTDGDGVSDGVEVETGYDPLDPNDHRAVVVAGGETEFAPGIVTLSASVGGLADASGCTPAWNQTSGGAVTLSGATTFAPTFVARKAGAFKFTVVATCGGVATAPATVTANVVNVAPMADAPRVTVVQAGERINLDARRSSDANGDAVAFAWEQVSGPAVAGGSSAKNVFARLQGEGAYLFKVTVTDPARAAGEMVSSVVAIGAKSVPSAAVVSPVVGQVGQPVVLDASGSYRHVDATIAWRQVAGPAVALVDGGAPVASFVAAQAGRYVFEVRVVQAGVAGPPAYVEAFVAAEGAALPVAVATAPADAPVTSAVALDGSASTSGSGGTLEYAWRQVSGPAAGLGSANRSLASAYLFTPGSYEFELTVKDAGGVGRPSRVRVDARTAGQPFPVARVTGPAAAAVGELVVLDGRASVGATKFRWTQLGGPWVSLRDGAVESFRPSGAGTYVFELEVELGQVRSAPVRVSVVVSDGTGN
jgi:hypothetical protein